MTSRKRTIIGNTIFVALLAAIAGLFVWAAYWGPKELGETTVEIGGELFTVPAEWDHWRYEYKGDAMGGQFKQLQFTLDVNTFQPIEAKYGDNITNNLHMEIRPLRSEFGEQKYWTDSDPAKTASPHNCRSLVQNGRELEACEYGTDVRLNSGAQGGFAIKDKATGDYLSMFGCLDRGEKFKTLNKVCTGRARILGDVQIEYTYRFENYPRAFELDQRARDIALTLHNP